MCRNNSQEIIPHRINHIDKFGKGLSKWEISFIANLIDSPPREYSPKQIEIINRIYDEKC